MVVDPPPGAADDKHNIDTSFDQCRGDRGRATLDRDGFADDTAVPFDRSAYHRPVAVHPSSGLCRLDDQNPHSGPADDRNPGYSGHQEQPDMARGEPRTSAHQCRFDRRDGALSFDVIGGRHCLDDLDVAFPIGLGELTWDHRIGPGRQSIATRDRNRREANWVIDAGSQRRARLHGKSIHRSAILGRDRLDGADVF